MQVVEGDGDKGKVGDASYLLKCLLQDGSPILTKPYLFIPQAGKKSVGLSSRWMVVARTIWMSKEKPADQSL